MDLRLYLLQRLASLVVVVFGASVLIFLIMRLLPGDPVLAMLGFDTTPEIVAEMRAEMGLDQPLVVQYGLWLRDALTGDLGYSIIIQSTVTDLLAARFPVTLHLAVLSLVVALAVAVPAGVFAAVHKGRRLDHLSRFAALAGVSMPNFWLGLLLMLLFAVTLGWLPVGGYVPLGEDVLASNASLLLPAVTLGTAYAATIMRMLRASMLDVLGRDYVAVARAFGLKERVVIWHDAFLNALIPTLTVSGFAFGYMLAGTIIVEVIFNIPGVGRLLYESILTRDYPLVQGIVLFNITLFVAVNFLVDVLYSVIDPRVRG